jgi:heptosyltransferase-2
MKKTVKNILIIKLAAIGDVVVASSLLPAIESMYPQARLTRMVGSVAADIVRAIDADMEILVVDEKILFKGSLWAKVKELFRIAWYFRFRHFSLVLIPQRSKKYIALRLGVRAGIVRAFWQERTDIPGRYQGVNYLRLLNNIDGNSQDLQNAVAFDTKTNDSPKPSSAFIDRPVFPSLRGNVMVADEIPDILLVPGGSKNILSDHSATFRRWPLSYYAALAKILTKSGYSVGIIGGSEDAWVKDGFEASSLAADFIGKYSLREVLAVLRRVKLLVTHDTGLLHMMGLVGGQSVALFGPTMPIIFAPLVNTTVIQALGFLPCRPCYDGRNFARDCTRPLCMEGITPDMVVREIERIFW